MRRITIDALALALGVLGLLGCAAPDSHGQSPDRRDLDVPRFPKGDPRVNTAGFVRQTTRIHRVVDKTTYTLMIFAVGDTLTLGAMIQGEFGGSARWTVGDRQFTVPLKSSNRGRKDVLVQNMELRGQHAGFRDFDWVNVEVPLAEWIHRGTPVRLEFCAEGAEPVVLPDAGDAFAARVVER